MSSTPTETFGDLLRRHRRAAGLTQEELAAQANMSARGISDLERSSRQRPYRDTLDLLVKALHLSGEHRAEFERAARVAPPPDAAPQPHHNLPLESSSFIGRAAQLEQVHGLLLELPVRLVTLTGPGGSGKTRLALQVAALLLDDFPDGVYFVNLAPVVDPALVLSELAQLLGVKEAQGQPLLDALRNHLQPRRILLLLDNFEQVLSAADAVAALLAAASTLKILVTSRVRLNLQGEHEYLVPPLALPAADQLLEQISQFDAVRLFVERARAIKSDFQLHADNAGAVAEITRRLDGLPLAIELAAARVKVLPPPALLARLTGALGTRLGLLTGGARDLPARQQTLRSAIAWSHDLLEGDEARLFRQLAVFVGGSTIAAVAAICDGGLAETQVLDALSSLVDQSLLRQEEGVDGEPRFVMLETIHEYAWEQLAASGELAALRRRHALYFMQLAEQAEPELFGGQQTTWLDRLEADHDNIRAALRWASEQHPAGSDEALAAATIGLRIAAAIWLFWQTRGYLAEGRAQLDRFLSLPVVGALDPSGQAQGVDIRPYRARALQGSGSLTWRQGNYAAAHPLLEDSLVLWRAVGDKRGIAQGLHYLAIMTQEQGDFITARALYSESLALRRELGDKRGIAAALGNLGNVAWRLEDYAGTRVLLEESLALRRELNDTQGIAHVLTSLGVVAHNQQEYTTARARYAEALSMFRELGHKYGMAATLGNLGNLAQEQGDYAGAATLHAESLDLRREIGDKQGIATTLGNLGSLAQEQGDYVAARALYAESLALRRDLADKLGIAAAVAGIAGVTVRSAANAASAAADALTTAIAAALDSSVRARREKIEGGTRLLGAVAGLLESMSAVLDSDDSIPYERSIALARAQLGENSFKQAWDEGHAMSLEQAIDHAFGYTVS